MGNNTRQFVLVLLLIQLCGCAAQNAYRRAQDAAKRGDWDRAVAQYMAALRQRPDNPQYRAGFERARLTASQVHFERAKQFVRVNDFEKAILEYQLALNFDPSNQFIADELERARANLEKITNKDRLTALEKAKEEVRKKSQLYKVLGPDAETMIQSLRFHDDSLKHILDSLGALAGINIVYDSDFRDQEFSVSLDNISFRNALEQILVANRLYYKPLDQSTILIIPDNPQKRRQYDEQVIQTFYLSNAELNDVLNLIRSVMQIQRIATNPQLNAITLRDTPDKIAIAQKIIEANDKSRSEILMDVEILEVDRDQALRYGIDLSTYTVTQDLIVNSTTSDAGATANVGVIFGNQFKAIDAASWRFTVPSLIYSALQTDQRTKLLAKPQIRASEGQQVTVRLGDRVPIPVNVIQTAIAPAPGQQVSTFPTTTFQQQDVGINIDVTPRVHHNREISLTMRFELTSITSPGVGTTPPTIGNRTVNTVIRLKDGETNLLAGLLRRDERKSLRGLPGIGRIPIIRELFAANERAVQEKDIIFTITPHILRTPNITEDDLAPIWIGTEDDIRLKPPPPISVFERQKMSKDKARAAEIPTAQEQSDFKAPVPPTETAPPSEVSQLPPPAAVVPKIAPDAESLQEQGPQEGATISFASPNVNPAVDTEIVVLVRLDHAAQAGNIYLYLSFDPALVQVKDVLQGPFATPGAFAKSFDNGRGTININANHTPGEEQSGVVATVVFHSLKQGQLTVNLNSAVIRDQESNVVPVTFLPFSIVIQ